MQIDIKRLYLPETIFKMDCPHCGKDVVIDFNETYLSYPIANVVQYHLYYCDNCDTEFHYKAILKLSFELIDEQPKRKT